MNNSGFSLIEILVTLTIVGIILATGSLQFNSYVTKGAIERQTRELYAEFMAIRTAAITQQKTKIVKMTPTAFTFYSSISGGGGTVVKNLSKPITWTGKALSETEMMIIFNEQGAFDLANNGNISICVKPTVENAQVDSIVVFSTRVHLGKVYFSNGIQGDCTSASNNITIK